MRRSSPPKPLVSFMIQLLSPFILTLAAATFDAHHADAVEVYRCGFEIESDANFDAWPDGWTRRTGKGYPGFVSVAIVDETDAAKPNKILRIDLDGGAATALSQPIPVSSQFNYVLEGRMKTERLKHNIAFFSFTFYDDQRRPVGRTYYSAGVNDAVQWRDVRLEITTPANDRVSQAVIGVHLRPESGSDLVGSVSFDDLSLARLPRMVLTGSRSYNIYSQPGEVQVTCDVSGVRNENAAIVWELFDVYGARLSRVEQQVSGKKIETAPAPEALADGASRRLPAAYAGRTSWHVPIDDFGFYRVSVSLAGGQDTMLARETTVAVLRPLERAADGEFGWSLPAGEAPLSLEALPNFLAEMGLHWVKFPIWRGDSDAAWPENFAKFYDRLAAQRINLIALIDQPPAEIRPQFGGEGELPIASVFLQADQWPAALAPLVQRQSLKVRWWQLGNDDDASFIGLPGLAVKMADIKSQMERYGQRIRLGFAWRWINDLPAAEHPPWSFVSPSIDPPLTAAELSEYLSQANKTKGRTQIWLSLRPLADEAYSLDVRVRDLVERMLAAKIGGADRIFVPDPLDVQRGLMYSDGTPRELMVVWRTAATLLAGAEYVGSIHMPNGSQNHVFARDGQAVMVVWNDKPTREVIYLGDSIEQIDPWGRSRRAENEGHRQIVEVGRLPSFLTGVNEPIARWRMAFRFNNDRLRSIFARPQNTSYKFTNTFDKTINGVVAVVGPKFWDIRPTSVNVRLPSGVSHTKDLRVQLGADSNSGQHPVRVDFEVAADRNYRFSVYRTIQVGLDDIQIEVSTSLSADGALVVVQQITNNTEDKVNFNCLLFAPNRRRERQQVIGLGRGKSTNTFVIPDGQELIGQTLWLRAEEIGGERILNFNVEAQH